MIGPRPWLLRVICAISGIAVGGALEVVVGQGPAPAPFVQAQIPNRTVVPNLDEFSPEERINISVYESVNRSVVHIVTKEIQRDDFFMMAVPAEGSGSGSVLDKQGHILTNYHVIEDAQGIQVALYDGSSYPATLVGQDPSNDVAVLRIQAPATALHPVRFGDSSRLRVGQKVYAIGNPFGLERTLTVGIISSLNRTLTAVNRRTIKSVIQIDAALNRGNSGGPLLNSHAELIGMNTAILSHTGENTGVGFAIPVNTIKRIVPQLIKNGRVIRPDLGVARVYQTEAGLLIAALAPGGPAERAGLRGFRLIRTRSRRGPYIVERTRIDQSAADTIVGIDGIAVRTVDDLLTQVEKKKPGETVVVRVLRGGQPIDIPVILGTAE